VNLGRVTGRVVCGRQVAELGAYRLALVQPVDAVIVGMRDP